MLQVMFLFQTNIQDKQYNNIMHNIYKMQKWI